MISHFSGCSMLKAARVVRPRARSLLTCTQSHTCVKKRRPTSPLPTEPDAALLPGGVGRLSGLGLPGHGGSVLASWYAQVLSGQRGARSTLGKFELTVSKGFRRSPSPRSSNLADGSKVGDHGLVNLGNEFHSIFPQKGLSTLRGSYGRC